ncbi:MAG: hypothetical protein EOO69_07255 [Moraxellaceae bacterium]|nr:MAG: hypothetical protein EOO69_07255 [Moraxellaceae bacterium]
MFKLLMGLAVFFLLVCILFFGLRFIVFSIASLFAPRAKQKHPLHDVQPVIIEHPATGQPNGHQHPAFNQQDPASLRQASYDHVLTIYDPVSNRDMKISGHVSGCSQQEDKAYINLTLRSGQPKRIAVSHIHQVHNQVTHEQYQNKTDIAHYFQRFL